MSERRRKYRYDRILIESDRILSPQFDDAVLYVTGAQLEMLRNVTGYLRNLQTYVDEYQPGYYLTPDVSDYDDILAIVADLEETLMGNPNTIWGYYAPYAEIIQSSTMAAGDSDRYGDHVPEGEVWRVFNIACWVESATCTRFRLSAHIDGVYLTLANEQPPVTTNWYRYQFDLTLKEGDFIYVSYYDMTLNDGVRNDISGYKMIVP